MANTLVTGANRGLGLECARLLASQGHTVFLAARDLDQARQAAAGLPGSVHPIALDVTRPDSIHDALRILSESIGTLEVLINNAGVYPSADANPATVDPADMVRTLLTNVAGPHAVTQACLPLLAAARPGACVVNVSSGLGSFDLCATEQGDFHDYVGTCYGTSKAALNMLTVSWAKHLAKARSSIRVNAVSPGWCRTDMGGSGAPRSPEDGARTLLQYAFLPPTGPTGQFFGPDGPTAW